MSSYRAVVLLYAALGVILSLLFTRLSPAAEAETVGEKKAFQATFAGLSGLDRSHGVVLKLSALFALDSFGGGFVVQSFAAYWFYLRFGVNPGMLGVIFFWANVFAGHLGARCVATRGAFRADSRRWWPRTCRRTCCSFSCR